MNRRCALLVLVFAMLAAGPTWAVDLPDFKSGYTVPDAQHPAPRPQAYEDLDLAFLIGAMSLASYFALWQRSRRGLYLLTIVSVAWLGFWRAGCACPIGAIQNVSLALFDPGYIIPGGIVAIFVLPLIFTLFFGRTFCAAVCPLGGVQELVAVRSVRVPTWLNHSLGLLPYLYLGFAVVLAAAGCEFIICRFDPFVSIFRLGGTYSILALTAVFLVLGVFVGRPYCRFLCPYGAILRLLSGFSQWRLRIPPGECIRCRLCEDACPYDAIQEPTVAPPASELGRGRRQLAVALVLLPVFVASGLGLGRLLEAPLASVHPTIQLAEQVWLEDSKLTDRTGDAADAFRARGEPIEELYQQAREVRDRMGVAAMLLGGWVGLVLGVKLVHLAVRRRRVDFQPDPSACLSCGRCFWYCPNEQMPREISPLPFTGEGPGVREAGMQ